MEDRNEKTPGFWQFSQGQGTVVQGTWAWAALTQQTNYASVKNESPGRFNHSATNNDLDEYKWSNIYLTKGIYKITLIYIIGDTAGIAEILFGNTSLGTKDCYAAVVAYNQVWELVFTLTSDITSNMRFRVNGTNPLSGAYGIAFSKFTLEKTG